MNGRFASHGSYGSLFARSTEIVSMQSQPAESLSFVAAEQDEEPMYIALAQEIDTDEKRYIEGDYSPENFVRFLENSLDLDDTEVITELTNYTKNCEVEYKDLQISDEDLTPLTKRIEGEIDKFIQHRIGVVSLNLSGGIEIFQLRAIFNPNNLLATAKGFVEMSTEPLSLEFLDMIYRYRTTIKRIEQQAELLAKAQIDSDYTIANNHRNGARTWGGDVREYGHVAFGVIDPIDYRDFDKEREVVEHDIVTVNGEAVKIEKRIW